MNIKTYNIVTIPNAFPRFKKRDGVVIMSGSDISQHWLIRLTTEEVYEIEKLIPHEFIAYVIEFGRYNKRHYHVAVTLPEGMLKTRNQMGSKTMIGAWFPGKGKAFISIKKWDGSEEHLRYMHKESIPKFFGHKLGLRTHEEYVKMGREWRVQNQRSKKKRECLIETVVSNVEEVTFGQSALDVQRLREVIVDQYFEYHDVNRLNLKSMFQIRNDIDIILFKMRTNRKENIEYLKRCILKDGERPDTEGCLYMDEDEEELSRLYGLRKRSPPDGGAASFAVSNGQCISSNALVYNLKNLSKYNVLPVNDEGKTAAKGH